MTPQAAIQACTAQGGATPSAEDAGGGRFHVQCNDAVVIAGKRFSASATGRDGAVTHVSLHVEGESLAAWQLWTQEQLGHSSIADASRVPNSWVASWLHQGIEVRAIWSDLRAVGRSTSANIFILRNPGSNAQDAREQDANADRRHLLHFDLEGTISDFRAACIAQGGDEIATTGQARGVVRCLGRRWVGLNARNEVYATPGRGGRIERLVFIHGRDVDWVLMQLTRAFGRAHQVVRFSDASAFNWFTVSSGSVEWNIEATTAGTVVLERQPPPRTRGGSGANQRR